MPKAMHSYFLRNMYQNNRLVVPGGIDILGEKVDLRDVKIPIYMVSTKEDHIAPWKSTYAATQLFAGPVKFVLSASGHIAGVVNPPDADKYCYWTNGKNPNGSGAWLDGARQHNGSWWTDWQKWMSRKSGGKADARTPGDGKRDILCPAPGEYVRVMLN